MQQENSSKPRTQPPDADSLGSETSAEHGLHGSLGTATGVGDAPGHGPSPAGHVLLQVISEHGLSASEHAEPRHTMTKAGQARADLGAHHKFAIREQVEKLQRIIQQKKQQFRVGNSGSLAHRAPRAGLRQGTLGSLTRGAPATFDARKSRLLDYFAKGPADFEAEDTHASRAAGRALGPALQERLAEMGIADVSKVHVSLDRHENADYINILLDNLEGTSTSQLHGSDSALGGELLSGQELGATRENFNRHRSWRNRSQNFSLSNKLPIRKRLQIENMLSYNFPKLLQLSQRALDYANVVPLPALADRQKEEQDKLRTDR